MQRRDFIKGVGGSAVVWPFATCAQQGDQVWRIGVLMQLGEGDPQSRVDVAASVRAAGIGRSEGRNPRIDTGVCFLKHQQ